MTSIQEKIKAAATADGTPWVFGSMNYINLLMDQLHQVRKFPCALSVQPIDGHFDTDAEGAYSITRHDTEHVVIGYADTVGPKDTPEQVNARVAALKRRCLVLLDALEAGGDFAPVSSQVNYSVLYDALDASMVIVLMDFYLRELAPACLDAADAR